MSSSVTCGNCGSNDLEYDHSRGDTYCTQCGNVIDENCIVSELQFQEGTHGSAHIVGQRHDSDAVFKPYGIGGILGAARESRQVTLSNAKRGIKTVCDQLRLNDHFIDMAFSFYKMALNRRLTHGRKHIHVIAACIYITCRSEGTPHMLLDLSDVSQVNVYELGRTYLKLTSALCITIPAIDPSLYIIRFAQHLHLGEKNNEVERMRNNIISTANRLVQRMKRDWMHYGRRPSGLCGAAILVAARLNEVHCSIKDVIKIVKVCETTIRKRLCEFSETPTSNLTLDEFMTIDLEGEEDPPCYKAAKRKQKLSQIDNEQQLDDIQNKISHLQKLIEKDLEKSRKKLKNPFSKFFHVGSNLSSSEEFAVQQFIVDDTVQTIEAVINKDTNDNNYELYIKSLKALRPTAASLGITQTVINIDNETLTSETSDINTQTDELDLTDINDEELDGYLLNDDEIDAKTNIWTSVHAEYLAEMKQKEELKAKEDEERRKKEASGEIQPKKKRKTKKKTQIQANSAEEAIAKMLHEKKLSNKINYDVLKSLNPTSSDMLTIKTLDTSIKHINNTQTHTVKPNLPLKRLTTLKNSSNTSLLNLKAPLFTKLKLKDCDTNVSVIKDSVNESEKTVANSLINLVSIETATHTVSEHNITDDKLADDEEELDELEEDNDDDYICDDYDSKIDDMLDFDRSGDNGDDNNYYDDYDDDY